MKVFLVLSFDVYIDRVDIYEYSIILLRYLRSYVFMYIGDLLKEIYYEIFKGIVI